MSRTAEAFTDATDALAGLRTQRQEMALAHAQEVAALKTTIRELRTKCAKHKQVNSIQASAAMSKWCKRPVLVRFHPARGAKTPATIPRRTDHITATGLTSSSPVRRQIATLH